jgi:hypothetical protein
MGEDVLLKQLIWFVIVAVMGMTLKGGTKQSNRINALLIAF